MEVCLNLSETFSEGSVGRSPSLRGNGEVRGGPWLDSEGGCEVRKSQKAVRSCQERQGEPGKSLALESPVATSNSEFPSRGGQNLLKVRAERGALSPRDFGAAGAGAYHLLDLPAEGFSAKKDLGRKLLPGSVSRALRSGDEHSFDSLDRLTGTVTPAWSYLFDGSSERIVKALSGSPWTYTLRDEGNRVSTEYVGSSPEGVSGSLCNWIWLMDPAV